MLILIAESKTMRADAEPVSPEEFKAHAPVFEDIADGVAARLRCLSRPELAAELGLGPKSSAQAFDDYYNFPDKSTGPGPSRLSQALSSGVSDILRSQRRRRRLPTGIYA